MREVLLLSPHLRGLMRLAPVAWLEEPVLKPKAPRLQGP